MPTSRAFAYNPSLSAPTGATQFGNLAIQSTGWTAGCGGLQWFNGPDEDLGYAIGYPYGGPKTSGSVSQVVSGTSVGFRRTATFSDATFLSTVLNLTGQSFLTASNAKTYLNNNGYWTSYTNPTLAGSLLFNGSSQYLTISPGIIFGAGAFTLEGWFYNSSVVHSGFVNKGIVGSPVSNPTGCMNLFFASNTTITSDKNGGGGQFTYTMASAISSSAWHYLIYNRNSNGVAAVYIDGVRCTATSTDTLNYNTATDTIGRHYGGYFPGYWTNMRITIGTAVYDSSQTTQLTPTSALTSLVNTKYLMLGAVVTTDTSGVQTVTNVGSVTQSSVKPF